VTTLPAPTMACSPMTTFERMVEPDPIDAPVYDRGLTPVRSVCRSPAGVVARG
jgi:hypothetical protein